MLKERYVAQAPRELSLVSLQVVNPHPHADDSSSSHDAFLGSCRIYGCNPMSASNPRCQGRHPSICAASTHSTLPGYGSSVPGARRPRPWKLRNNKRNCGHLALKCVVSDQENTAVYALYLRILSICTLCAIRGIYNQIDVCHLQRRSLAQGSSEHTKRRAANPLFPSLIVKKRQAPKNALPPPFLKAP